ncbi:MAG: HD domain-containing phosphohydrolase [Oscillospiraceae bacterium]
MINKDAMIPPHEHDPMIDFTLGNSDSNFPPISVITIDTDYRIISINSACTEITGYTNKELINQSLFDLLIVDDIKAFKEKIDGTLSQYLSIRQAIRCRSKNNPIWWRILVDKSDFPGVILYCRDITEAILENKKLCEKVSFLSEHDGLTGLYNRRYFEKAFERLNAQQKYPLGIIVGDVNGLKTINSNFGYHYGDQVLIQVSDIMKRTCTADTVIARIAGDEFGILLQGNDDKNLKSLVSRIERQIKSLNAAIAQARRDDYQISITFGYAAQCSPSDSMDHIMREAEEFMYCSKNFDSRSLRSKTISVVMKALFEKSSREELHSERVGDLSASLATALGLESWTVNQIQATGYLHDIGKIGIAEEILNKKGKLNDEEWKIMKSHVVKGSNILRSSRVFSQISEQVLCHHERWDGTGYPNGLRGVEIPLSSRIVAVADAYDAMTNSRSYRKKITHEEAIQELKRCSGTHFDPQIVTAFIGLFENEGK